MAQMRTTVVVTERKRCLMGQVHNLTRTVRVVATTMGEVIVVMLFGIGMGLFFRFGRPSSSAVWWSGSVLRAEPVTAGVPLYTRT